MPRPSDEDGLEAKRLRASLKKNLFGTALEPLRVDRFTILEQVGAGGMGIVYAAYDPQLDRRIAVKLLRRGSHTGGPHDPSRLLREAQAMARLSHPNVVQVYQAGWHDDQVFLAMEFVRGATLREWCGSGDQTWLQIVDKYVQAARGLQAAHRAGLIHRDFKPANALVDNEGRVRVTDFGTARAESATTPPSSSSSSPPFPSSSKPAPLHPTQVGVGRTMETPSWDDRMTAPGSTVGTPAYMSPEQHRGEEVDARSDQFSLCIALYEALFGDLPFAGQTRAALTSEVLAGRVRPIPKHHPAPRWLRRAILRGLALEPDRRFPDMGALIRALTRPRQRYRRGVVIAAGVTALMVWLPTFALRSPACRSEAEAFAGIWDPAAQATLERRFHYRAELGGAPAWERLRRNIDAYVSNWQQQQVAACEATHVRHRQSQDLLDRRMWCLDHRKSQLAARLDATRSTDHVDTDAILTALTELPDLGACANGDLLREGLPPPSRARDRERIAEIRAELSRATAPLLFRNPDQDAGSLGERVLDRTRAALNSARAIDFPPLHAEALYHLGIAQAELDDPAQAYETLLEAAFAAEAGRHAQLLVPVWRELASLAATGLDRLDWAEFLLQRAEASLARFAVSGVPQARVMLTRGMIEARNGDHDRAEATFQRAAALANELPDSDRADLLRADADWSLANVLDMRGETRRAIDLQHAALARASSILGEDHIRPAKMRYNLAMLHLANGDAEASRRELARAQATYLTHYGPSHARLGAVEQVLAETSRVTGKIEHALRHADNAIRIFDTALAADNPRRAGPRRTRARLLLLEGRHAEALALYAEIRDQWAASPARGDAALTEDIGRIYAHIGLGEAEQAGPYVARIKAAFEVQDHSPALQAWALRARALAAREDQQPDRAVSLLQEALKQHRLQPDAEPYEFALTHFDLARARHQQEADHELCSASATRATAIANTLHGSVARSLRAQIRAWDRSAHRATARHLRTGSE
ncbi:MAG: serine/threonine-protein kinase [Nannocystaceae bacterium]